MDLREIACEGVDRMYLAQDRDQWRDFVNTVMKFGFHKGGKFLDWLSDC